MEGFESAHSPKKIGCESCHLGNSFTSNKDFAHRGMLLIPGNLSDAEKLVERLTVIQEFRNE